MTTQNDDSDRIQRRLDIVDLLDEADQYRLLLYLATVCPQEVWEDAGEFLGELRCRRSN